MSSHHTRFKDCPWYSDAFPRATIGGVGGIGSWLSFFLGRIGVPMDLYDFDSVDYTNMGGQLFPVSSIGQQKSQVVKQNIHDFSGTLDVKVRGRFEFGDSLNHVVFTCFDNMKAREEMIVQWAKAHIGKRLMTPAVFIDGRMTVESFQVYAITPDRVDEYIENHIFPDSRIHEPLCSMKATSHIGAMIGSIMTQVFTNYMTNFNTGLDMREIPFRKVYEASFLDFI